MASHQYTRPPGTSTRRRFLARSAAAVAGLAAAGAGAEFLLDGPAPPPPIALGGALHAGSEWHLAGSSGSELDYRGPGALATPTIRIATAGDATETRVTLGRTDPVSLRGKLLRIWLRVEPAGAASLRQINVQVGSGDHAFERYAYQSVVLVDTLASYELEYVKPGGWASLTICPASIASAVIGDVDYDNLQDFALSVSDDGTGPAAVLFGGMQVIDANPGFPRGVVSFTFDDGLLSQYVNAKPVLDAAGYAGTAYLIHELVGERGYVDAAQLARMQRDGWELAMHSNSVALHNAPHGLVSAQGAEMVADWQAERRWLASLGARGTRDLALPQGYFDRRVADLARSRGGFDTVRTSSFRSIETVPMADPLRLRTIGYDVTVPTGPATELGSLMWRIDQVAEYGGWLILSFHEVVSGTPFGSEIGLAKFRELVRHVAQRRVPVRTVAHVAGAAGKPLDRLPRAHSVPARHSP